MCFQDEMPLNALREKLRGAGVVDALGQLTRNENVNPGDVIAVIDRSHDDRPQLGNVTAVTEDSVQLNWLLGTYTSVFKPYKVGGKVVTASIPFHDVIMYDIKLTKGHRLEAKTRDELKRLYQDVK